MCGYSAFLCNTPSKIELHLGLSLCLSVFWLLVNCSLSKGGSEKMSQQTWADSANVSRQSFNLKFGFWNVSKIFQKFPTQLSNQPFFSTYFCTSTSQPPKPCDAREEALNQIDYKGSLINIALDASWHKAPNNDGSMGSRVFGKNDGSWLPTMNGWCVNRKVWFSI